LKEGIVGNFCSDVHGHFLAKVALCQRLTVCHIQGVSGGIVNILGGGSMDYSQ